MIINRLIVSEYNDIDFVINHTENGEKYTLPADHRYYMIIAESNEPFGFVAQATSEDEHMHFNCNLNEGVYVFELGTIGPQGDMQVVLPALDEKLRPMNQLIVLRRLKYAAVQ